MSVKDRPRPRAEVRPAADRPRTGAAVNLRRWVRLRHSCCDQSNLTADEAEALAAELIECARRVRAEQEGATT